MKDRERKLAETAKKTEEDPINPENSILREI